MVPNSVVLERRGAAAARARGGQPARAPARRHEPGDLQEILEKSLQTPLREPPRITLEELDGDEVVVRIAATPLVASQGRHLASELLAHRLPRDALTREHAVAQEQLGAAAQHAQQLQLGRRHQLAAGEDPQRLAARPARRPARIGETVRNSSSSSPSREQLPGEVRPALAQHALARREALAQLGHRFGEIAAAGVPGAHVLDVGGAAAAGSPGAPSA